MTLGILGLFVTLSMNDTQHYVIMMSVVMLSLAGHIAMLDSIRLRAVTLNVVMLIVIMLNVSVPLTYNY